MSTHDWSPIWEAKQKPWVVGEKRQNFAYLDSSLLRILIKLRMWLTLIIFTLMYFKYDYGLFVVRGRSHIMPWSAPNFSNYGKMIWPITSLYFPYFCSSCLPQSGPMVSTGFILDIKYWIYTSGQRFKVWGASPRGFAGHYVGSLRTSTRQWCFDSTKDGRRLSSAGWASACIFACLERPAHSESLTILCSITYNQKTQR